MYTEDDLLPLSALQHLAFCERQWALIHLERQWAENRLTAEGRILHDAAHVETTELRDGIKLCRGLRLRSLRWGLTGQADVVEFRPDGPLPVEYKRGQPRPEACDDVQLCAQALCLEEMLSVLIPFGDLFYGQRRRRARVNFDAALRSRTAELIHRLRALQASGMTPRAQYAPKCENCSLIGICLPKSRSDVRAYFAQSLNQMAGSAGLE